jgi:heptosyltransferase-3
LNRLIIRPGAIGDCVLALPAIEHLRAERTEVWVASQNIPLVRFADAVRSIASAGLDSIGIPDRPVPVEVFARLGSFDSIVSWYGTKRPEFRAAVAGLPFTFLAAQPDCGTVHAADFFLRQVGNFPLPAIPRIECDAVLRDYAVIHPFSGSAKKNWPLDRFRELASRLKMPVCWCAGPEEPLENAVRFDDLYKLACWLAGARLYVGNDSGITHLAAAVETPVVALFGPTDPAVWAPRGENVRVVATPRPGEPMDRIELDAVLRAAEELRG